MLQQARMTHAVHDLHFREAQHLVVLLRYFTLQFRKKTKKIPALFIELFWRWPHNSCGNYMKEEHCHTVSHSYSILEV